MSFEISLSSFDELKDTERLYRYQEILESLNIIKETLEKGVSESGVKDGLFGDFVLKEGYKNESYNRHMNLAVADILLAQNKESLHLSTLKLTEHGKLNELVKSRSQETTLYNDLAHFSLNHLQDFSLFCLDTLNGITDKTRYSDDFLEGFNKFYHRSPNFTNTFLSFYMENINKVRYLEGTSKQTENFSARTELASVRKNKDYYNSSVQVRDLIHSEKKVFIVNLDSAVRKVLSYLFQEGLDDNPFRIRVNGLNYYRDLDSNFSTYNRFEEVVKNQFIENILVSTHSQLLAVVENKAYLTCDKEVINSVPDQFKFKVYGISFNHEVTFLNESSRRGSS